MTKKDFELIAEALANCKPISWEHETWVEAVMSIADALEAANPRFNRNKFLTWCGWNMEKGAKND